MPATLLRLGCMWGFQGMRTVRSEHSLVEQAACWATAQQQHWSQHPTQHTWVSASKVRPCLGRSHPSALRSSRAACASAWNSYAATNSAASLGQEGSGRAA